MRTYSWQGILQSGEQRRGLIRASNTTLAKKELQKQGILARKISRHFTLSRITSNQIGLFIRQLATLIHAGIPLNQALNTTLTTATQDAIKPLIQHIKSNIESGLMLNQAFSHYPRWFNPLFCSMIRAGELSGTLDTMLLILAKDQENSLRIKKAIRKALHYPFVVVLIAGIVTSGLLVYVIPQFANLFTNFHAKLPGLTQMIIKLSYLFKQWWLCGIGIGSTTLVVGFYGYKHYPAIADIIQRIVVNIPIIGNLLKKMALARFIRTISITFAAGLPLTEALNTISGIGPYSAAARIIQNEMAHGYLMHQAMQKTNVFPDMAIQLISIGEESGTLETMFTKIADIYEQDIEIALNTFTNLLEPLIMTILGLAVGGLVIAMYLPILQLGSIL